MASGPGAGAPGGDSRSRNRRFSVWGPVVLVLVAALSVVAWAVVRQGVARQSDALLTNEAQQIEILLQSTLSSLQGQLRAAAFITTNAGNSPTVFAQQAAALRTQPTTSVAVVDLSGPTPKVVAAAGPGLTTGETLPAALSGVARAATTSFAGGLVHLGAKSFVALAAAPSIQPQSVAMELSPAHPDQPQPTRSGPYSHVYVNLYASPTARTGGLVFTTYGPRPLPAPVATAPLRIGSIHWLIAVSPRDPLVGSTAATAPWLLLGIGLFIAALLAVLVELLARRQRYAQNLVDERTAELVEAQRSLVRQERLAAIGEMASVVSHELRNPLSAVINDLFLLRHGKATALDADGERHLSNAEREVYRAARLSEDLLAYTREREPQWADVSLDTLVADVLESVPPPAGVQVAVASSISFRADPALMNQVLSNLLSNAYQAMPDGGSVQVEGSRRNGTAVVSVQDTGAGFDPEVAARLFDPFFTTREGGTGLGLAIVQRLVQAHDGQVSLENVPGGGARVAIELPDGPAAR